MTAPIQKLPESKFLCKVCFEPCIEFDGYYICPNKHRFALYQLIEREIKPVAPATIKKSKHAVQKNCKYCGKILEIVSETKLNDKTKIVKYSCGHSSVIDLLAVPEGRDEKWNKFFKFQQEGIEFIENANYDGLIGDEMGLGKTIQALGTLRYNYEQLTPCLIICESSKVYDWKNEFKEWVGDRYTNIADIPIIHNSGKYGLVPGMNNHIISMSLLQKKDVIESIKEYEFKFLIVDESHSFKNELAARSNALQDISKNVPHKVFLTGTPIMNRVSEYFVPLNILRPTYFPSKSYLTSKCDRTSDGRILGLSSWYRDKFFEKTSEFIIRRTKKQVGIQLPQLRIEKTALNLSADKTFVRQYNNLLDDLETILNKLQEDAGMANEIMVIITKLRQIIGIAKVKPIIALVEEFMESTDPEDKIAIGVHHKFVMDLYQNGLSHFNPICISDESPEIKMKRIEQFKKPEHRLAVLSILGAGQGLNLQFCQNAIIAEREWNPAKETQFAGRFHRPLKNSDGSLRTDDGIANESVIIDYINATDSIDDFFDAIVNLKKEIVDSTIDKDYLLDRSIMMELAHKIVQGRMKAGF